MGSPALKSIETQLAAINKQVGNKDHNSLNVYKKRPKEMGEVISFGLPAFDDASNIGGHYQGSCIELFGLEAGGKTYAAMKTVAEYQRLGKRTAWFDIEHSFVPEWAEQAGIDLENDTFVFAEDFQYGEHALEAILALCVKKVVDIVVLDSVTALLPKAEVEGTFEQNYMATHARMMSQAVKHIIDAGWKSKVTQININQIRTKPGVMFGNPEDTPGGKALKYYAHLRMDVRRKSTFHTGTGEDKKPAGIVSGVRFVKNRYGAPGGKSEFEIHFSQETNSPVVQLLQMAAKLKVLPNRKTVDGTKCYVWGRGSDAITSDAATLPEFAGWLDINDLIPDVLKTVVEAAKTQEIQLPPEVMSLQGLEMPTETTEDTEAEA